MWEYKIRERLGATDCGGEYGFRSEKDAIAAFKRAYPENWKALACTVYAPGYRPVAEKEAGNVRFRH